MGEARNPANGAVPIDEAVGRRVRQLREEKCWSQLHLATLAVSKGLNSWRRPLIANLEAGRRRLDLGEAIVLASVFGVPVADLLPPDAPVHVTEHRIMRPNEIRWYLTGGGEGARERTVALEGDAGLVLWHFRRQVEADTVEAKACRALHIDRALLRTLSRRLWAQSLPNERDRRFNERPDAESMSARSRQAHKGRITRKLLDEVREEIAKQHARSKGPRKGRPGGGRRTKKEGSS